MGRLAGRIILLWGWKRALLAFLAGALATLAQAPYDFFAVGFISFPILVWLLDGATPLQSGRLRALMPAFTVGWWFGFGYFLAGLWWVGAALLVEADSFAWALPIAVLGLPALLAIFYGLAAALARIAWSDGLGRIAALAAAFGFVEWLRTFVLTGFPWNPVGYMAMPVPLLMQSSAVAGMVGMSVLSVFVFAVPALLAARIHVRTGIALAVLLAGAHLSFGYFELHRPIPEDGTPLSVRIVQPNIDQSEKWDQTVRDRIFKDLLDLSGNPPASGAKTPELILWPETSVPFLLADRPDALVAIGELLQPGQTLLAGIVREEGSGEAARYYNSVTAINDAGEIIDSVDKVHLVPFGEYLPFQRFLSRLGVQKIVTLPMDFSAGASRHPIVLKETIKAVPLICYEVIFPALVETDTKGANLMVSVTNDAWFGDTPGPYQHVRQAQIRAAETGIPAIRAANTGVSAVIDAHGRITDALAVNAKGGIDADLVVATLEGSSTGSPSRNGLYIILGFAACSIVSSVAGRRMRD